MFVNHLQSLQSNRMKLSYTLNTSPLKETLARDNVAHCGLGRKVIILPPKHNADQISRSTSVKTVSFPVMTEQDVRLILANYAKSSWSMDDDFARNVAIVRIEQVVAYHYKLRTFTEQRSIRKILEPFKPTAIDEEFTCNLATPPLWKMPIFPKTSFHSHDIKMDVPDMTIVGWCDMCHGGGQVDCACATRRRSCPFCSIDRKCTCRKCNGQQTLRYRLQLTVKWSSYQDDFVSLDCTTLTDKQLIQAQGVDLLNELCYQVSPVTSNADKLIREKSTELIDKYKSNTLNKIIRQQQVIRAIPVTIVTYRKESHDSRFFVYGHDNRVNFPLERRDNSCIIS